MSNISSRQIICIVADLHGLAPSELGRAMPGNFRRSRPLAMQARDMACYLIFRHTQETASGICRILGLSVHGEARVTITRSAAEFAVARSLEPDVERILEAAERLIDIHHEQAPLPPPMPRRALRKPTGVKIKPPRPVGVEDMTREWWAANDAVFRRAILEAAE